jgi:hypothetical protein
MTSYGFKSLAIFIVVLNVLGSFWLTKSVFATHNANHNSNGNNNPGSSITICHATSSNSNPYIVNTPNANGSVDGHDNHDGPIWPSVDSQGNWGDIIPPFSYNDNNQTLQYLGQNWDTTGQSIWNNNCNIPVSSASPSPSNSPIVSPSPTPGIQEDPSATPSASPSASPSNTPSTNNPSGGTVDNSVNTSSNQTSGEVLGTTTLAATGSNTQIMTIISLLGIVLMITSLVKYAQEIA